ncbi:DNA polymerase III subunit beta [Fodinicola feengrottensis]|uniref:DNA polymerase III subunit beta n=1 Tax=Fodinicola feengrottensis TaxID=435914 RepID=UPI0024425B04|nr:DNA polymerase III subunit beta [Fodinicola feengrottensis]
MGLDLTAPTSSLAAAAVELTRLLPGRITEPVLAGVLVRADRSGVRLAGTDRERFADVSTGATTHTEGTVLVPARPLADTLRALQDPEVRLVTEGSRLAIRTPSARFALPLLEIAIHPGIPAAPRLQGTVRGDAFGALLAAVAGAASTEDALPIFTGVRIHSDGDRLRVLATDRYRLSVGHVPWEPATPEASIDVLAPAGMLVDAARRLASTDEASVHADGDRIALRWGGTSVSTVLLAGQYPDQQLAKLLDTKVECTIQAETDELAAAVRRATLYSGASGSVTLTTRDSGVTVTGHDPLAGESEETIKAEVTGNHLTTSFRARYLTDALRAFTGAPVLVRLQSGMAATAITAPPPPTTPAWSSSTSSNRCSRRPTDLHDRAEISTRRGGRSRARGRGVAHYRPC